MNFRKIFKPAAIFFLLIISFSVFSAWVDQDGAGQGEIDISNDPSSVSYIPSIAIDSKGYPHIAWYGNDPSGNLEIYYLYWNGLEWVDADGSGRESMNISQTSTNSEYPRLVLDSMDRPHITWEDGIDYDREVYYLYWNGSAWVDATGSGRAAINVSNMPLYSGHPAIALDSMDRPNICWSQQDPDDDSIDIYYAAWNGTQWTGASSPSPEKIYNSIYDSLWPYICVDASNRPHITWADGPDWARDIYYLKYNGSAWVDAAGIGTAGINISNTEDYSAWPKMDIDSAGHPHIVWEEDRDGGQNIYYLHWNGTQWVDVDGMGQDKIDISKTYHYATVPMIKLDAADIPHVIWSEGAAETCDVMCVKWNGSDWTDETGNGDAFKDVYHDNINSEWQSFALDKNGYPHIAWSDGIIFQEHDIFYLHWKPEGTPTVSPTFNPYGTAYPTATDTKSSTLTPTITMTSTITPVPAAVIFPDPCWADADGTGSENDPISSGSSPLMKLDSSGRPHIVWVYNGSVYYMKWNGFNWVDADGYGTESIKISGTVFGSAAPDMVLDSMDRPHIAWTGFFTNYRYVYYLTWDGASWKDVSGMDQMQISVPIVEGGYAQDVSLALDSSNRPNLAWSDYSQNSNTIKDIFYFKWNGSDWVDCVGVSRTAGQVTDTSLDCTAPSLKIDPAGFAHIAYKYGMDKIRYLKWNSVSWVDSAGTGQSHIDAIINGSVSGTGSPKLLLDPFLFPAIAFPCTAASTIYPCFVKWNGSAWVDAYGAGQSQINLPSVSNVRDLSMAYDSSGRPQIAWAADNGIYFVKWNGTSWVDADGSGTESSKILSYTDTGSRLSVDISAGGIPAVAWDDNSQNYFLRYICATPVYSPTCTRTITINQTATATAQNTVTPTLTPTPRPVLISISKDCAGSADGTEVIYTIKIRNDPDRYIYNIEMWDTLPSQLEFIQPLAGPQPVVTGQYIFWDWGGGMVNPGEEMTVIFRAKIRNIYPGMLFANIAAADYYDDYYSLQRHPAVLSNQTFYPKWVAAVYPNPYNPLSAVNGTLKFVNIQPNSTILIYSLSGEIVTTLNADMGYAYWNGRNSYGNTVSPGVYYYVIENQQHGSSVIKGKIYLIKN
jgi:hypothetical protein